MTDLDHQVAALLRAGSADLDTRLGWDPDALARGGLARGRRRRSRRRAGSSLAALALLVVAGVGVAVGVDDDTRRAVDPPVADTPTPSPSAAPTGSAGPRALAVSAAGLPDTFASLLPGDVRVPAGKPGEANPMDGFDPRARFDGAPAFPATEPGPGIYADLRWNGVQVKVSVAPSDPSLGDTPLQRCVGGGEGANGTCVATPDGGALQETSFPADGGYDVRIVNRYTPDRWVVTAAVVGPGDGPTLAQLETVATSDVWFG